MNLECLCGGELIKNKDNRANFIRERMKALGNPRYSKKTRLKKKFLKQWEEKVWAAKFAISAAAIIIRPGYTCNKCGKVETFYSALSQNIIKIEPEPPCCL